MDIVFLVVRAGALALVCYAMLVVMLAGGV